MSENFNELISVAIDLKIFFQIYRFEVCYDENGSYVDFRVLRVVDLPRLVSLAKGHVLKFFPEDDHLIVRLFERGNN